jgi:predicted amidohydrolase
MKAALAVHRVVADPLTNLQAIVDLSERAAAGGANLVVFSETAITGFIGTDDPAHDRALAQPVPGPATARLSAVAVSHALWLAFGLYERRLATGQDRLYDAAVLLGPDGAIHLHYRRLTPQWHWPAADPAIYRQGRDLPVAATPFGRCAFLLCGDLFDAAVLDRLRRRRADLLLVPFARRFDSEVADATEWAQVEQFQYARQVACAGVTTLLVNYLADSPATGGCFGGALAVGRDGAIAASLPPGQEGLLVVDLERQP